MTVLTSTCKRLSDAGCLLLSDRVRSIAKDTTKELADARALLVRMEAVGWDMTYVFDMHE